MLEESLTVSERMTVLAASLLEDNDLGFVGVGTAGRAGALAVGMPLAAGRLAQELHAPGYDIFWANMVSPWLEHAAEADWLVQSQVTMLRRAASPPDISFKVDTLASGRFDVAFSSGAQVDRYGNLNITWVGPTEERVRLVGCLAQPEHLAFARKVIIMMDLSPRSFVEEVDFITSPGHRPRGGSREDFGLPGGGPTWVVSDHGLFDFHGTNRSMRLVGLYPGVRVDDVLANMSFKPEIADDCKVLPDPSEDAIGLLRERIDPTGALIGGR